MKKTLFPFVILAGFLLSVQTKAQTNMFLSNPEALKILSGDYNPNLYRPNIVIDHPDTIRMGIIKGVSADRMINSLIKLETFYNRNSGADTLSLTTGIGACRSWILAHFDQVNRDNGNRLLTGYLEFDADICGSGHHKNPFAILPGLDTTNSEIIVIAGHFDTRNEERCDTQGYTPGIDDNGSGTVLVMELARVMSQYAFDHTIMFTTPTGEDEGLFGARAWAEYLSAQKIKIRAVLNNDIVGGIYCGKTSPQPSCPYWGHADSTHVRIFSFSPNSSMFTNSPHKQLARYVKYVQEELINPHLATPLYIKLYLGEDRSGRGGDQTPFRQKGYPAIRIISANEHGDGTGTAPDRNHTKNDVLGRDYDGDDVLDSLYINPGYLARNTIMNGVAAALLANSPDRMSVSIEPAKSGALIRIDQTGEDHDKYIIGIRKYKTRSLEFDTLFYADPASEIPVELVSGQRSFITISAVNDGAPGFFSNEYEVNLTGTDPIDGGNFIKMDQNYPNPWDTETRIRIDTPPQFWNRAGTITIRDLIGRLVFEKPVHLDPGEIEVPISSDQMSPGIYVYSLEMPGHKSQNLLMVKKQTP